MGYAGTKLAGGERRGRWHHTSVLGLFAVLLASATALCQIEPAQMFRGDLRHSGVYDAAGVPAFSRVKWTFHAQGQIIASPTLAGDTVYVGATDGNLYAVDRETGAAKWKFDAKGRIASSAAVAGGLVYFGAYNGAFDAVDAATGKQRWTFSTGGERRFAARHLHGSQPAAETMPDPFDCFLSSPAVADGVVYFGSGDGNVYALDAASGALKWKFATGDVVHASPAVADGAVYVGSWDSYFYALDAATGKLRWRFKTGEDPDTHNQVGIQSSAAVVDGVVYFGCRDSHLYALNAATGEQLWAFPTKGSWVVGSPAVSGGKVYFATSDSGLLFALDAKTGAEAWSLSFKGWTTFSSPAIAGNNLYVGSASGRLLAVDLAAHQLAWAFATEASKQYGPALTKPDGTPNYEAAFTSDFYDDMMSGYAKMMTVGPILSSPAVSGNVVYVGGTDGNLYALI